MSDKPKRSDKLDCPTGEEKGPASDDGLTQSERFIKAAQEIGTDDDPERFKERVRQLARSTSPSNTGKAKTNS